MFCSLRDLQTESDVEQKLLWPLLSQPSPQGLAYDPAEIATKRSLRRLLVGKGGNAKLYYPDYALLISGIPLLVVEAKAPPEDPSQALAEARLYASQLNEAFPTGVNPCGAVVACNGREIVASSWDSSEIAFRIPFEEINVASALYAAFVDAHCRKRMLGVADQLQRRAFGWRPRRAVTLMGGASVRNEEIGHNTFGSTLALDFRHVFAPSSQADRAYLVKNAYVRSRRRDRYVEPIEKLIRDISVPATKHLNPIEDTGDPREILRALSRGTALERQVMLLVGSVGSGKSTFVDHLVNVALPADLLKRTVWLRVNLNLAPREQMQSWLISQIARELKASEPETDFDELETLMVLYSAELNQLRKGPLRLLDPESQSYKERLADRLMQLQADQTLTVNALTRHLCAERGRLLIVVLDNADKRTRDEQLSVFQLAQWLQSELRCLTVLPLRDTTYDSSRNDPPLDTAQKDLVFRIEPPQFTSVLSQRVALALKELSLRGERQLEYQLPNGIRVAYPSSDQGMYLACILRSLYEHDRFLRRLLSGLAGRNIRKALEIFLEFCQSGYIGEGEILKIRQFEGDYVLPMPIVASVLLRLHRRFYDGDSSFVKNLFQADPAEPIPDHFVRLATLRFLDARHRTKGPSGAMGYHPVSELLSALARLGHRVERIRQELLYLLKSGCIVAEHQGEVALADADLVTLSSAGAVHLEMLGSVHYLAACAEDTWLAEHEIAGRIAGRIGSSRLAHMANTTVVDNARDFVDMLAKAEASWPRHAEAFLEEASRESLHEWREAIDVVEWEERELNRRARTGRLFVGNLPFEASEDDVAAVFSAASLPVLDVHMPKDASGKGRGFGFVSVGDADAAMRALRVLQGARVGRRPLQVRVAEERPPLRRRK